MYSIEKYNDYKTSIKCTHHNQIQWYTKWFCLFYYEKLFGIFIHTRLGPLQLLFLYLFFFNQWIYWPLIDQWPLSCHTKLPSWNQYQVGTMYILQITTCTTYVCINLSIWLFRRFSKIFSYKPPAISISVRPNTEYSAKTGR